MTPPKRRCLLCRQDGNNSLTSASGGKICSIFGLPDDHSFKDIFGRGQYCDICSNEVEQAVSFLTDLENLRLGLLRFQTKVYSKLEDNYFQIETRDKLILSCDIFDAGGSALKGRKFSYDEIVKVLYEKLRNNCFSWKTFQTTTDSVSSSTPVPGKSDSSTQTEVQEPIRPPSPPAFDNDTEDSFADDHQTFDDDNDDTAEDTGFAEDSSKPIPSSTSSEPLPDLPFFQTSVNLTEKIFCTVDPQNCSKFFLDPYNLKVHELSVHQNVELPHICPTCNKGFANIRRLRNHYLRIHTNSCAFLCPECGKGFPTKSALSDHNRYHGDKKPGNVCSYCALKLPSPEERDLHEAVHRANSVPYACILCPNLAFPSTASLKNHVAQLHRSNEFPCKLCGKLLATERSLGIHMKSHMGAFACEMCGFQCGSANALKLHQQTHSDERPFTCEVCGKGFRIQKHLKGHMTTHSEVKPFKCLICGKGFNASSSLKSHELTHQEGYSFECDECGKKFKTKEVLRKHVMIHKPGYVPRKHKPHPKGRKRTEAEKIKRRERERAKREAAGRGGVDVTARRRRKRKVKSETEDESGGDEEVYRTEYVGHYM